MIRRWKPEGITAMKYIWLCNATIDLPWFLFCSRSNTYKQKYRINIQNYVTMFLYIKLLQFPLLSIDRLCIPLQVLQFFFSFWLTPSSWELWIDNIFIPILSIIGLFFSNGIIITAFPFSQRHAFRSLHILWKELIPLSNEFEAYTVIIHLSGWWRIEKN